MDAHATYGRTGNRRQRPPQRRQWSRTTRLHWRKWQRRNNVVRPYVGYGVWAEFDPITGALRATPGGANQLGGVYAELGEVPVVLYRQHGRLGLRVGNRDIDLDGPVAIDWYPHDRRNTRFVVSVAGVPAFDVIYRSVPADGDLGLLVRDVLADPARRAAIFA